jgi:nucleotide-binding universal stress UspA family protein
LLLVHIVPAIPVLPEGVSIFKEGEFDSELHEKAAKQLQKLASTLANKNLSVRTEVGTANDVGMELVRIAEHDNVDMIVIATHGMTGWLCPEDVKTSCCTKDEGGPFGVTL